MKASTVSLVAALGVAGCTGQTGSGQSCSDLNSVDPACGYNRDQQIDGFAELAEDDGYESHDVRMCTTPNGRIYAGWIDDREGFEDVWFAKSVDGGTVWSEPIRVKQGANSDASGMQLACAGDRIYMVWEDDRDGDTGYENIYLNFSADEGATWLDEDVAIDNDEDGTAISLGPQIVLHEGRVHVVWFDQVEGSPDVYMSTSINGGNVFQEPVRISGDREDDGAGQAWSGKPKVAVDNNGALYVVWEDTRNGKLDIFFASSTNGGQSFNPQKRIDKGDTRGANNSFSPAMAAEDGHIYTVWHDERNGARDIYMNYSADGGDTWFESALIVNANQAGFFDSLNAAVAIDGEVGHIVWEDARNTGFDIYYRKASGGAFAGADDTRLDTDDPGFGNSLNPVIARDGDVLVAAWEDRRADVGENYNDLYYSTIDLGAESPEWSDPDLRVDSVVEGTSFAVDLNVAIYEGSLYSAWKDGRTGSASVFFSAVELGSPIDAFVRGD